MRLRSGRVIKYSAKPRSISARRHNETKRYWILDCLKCTTEMVLTVLQKMSAGKHN